MLCPVTVANDRIRFTMTATVTSSRTPVQMLAPASASALGRVMASPPAASEPASSTADITCARRRGRRDERSVSSPVTMNRPSWAMSIHVPATNADST